ncbi:hypothetical protein NP493_383g01048 [Ridgeia piscesae]|uniref:Uncharacterized protein n=1 Tax=Ridgeia piscesae TaxID=27915 RepID=A0AAD9L1Y2_RIDPI|nr:hypothetical protein NP493_383g01048 [Ridgeia piscesae]
MNRRSSSAPARRDANFPPDASKFIVRGVVYVRAFRPTGNEENSAADRLSRTTYAWSAKAYPSLPPASPRWPKGPVPNHLPAFRRLPSRSVDKIVTRVSTSSNGTWRRIHDQTPRKESAASRATVASAKQRNTVRSNSVRPDWNFY